MNTSRPNNINSGMAIDGHGIALILRFQKLCESQTQKWCLGFFI